MCAKRCTLQAIQTMHPVSLSHHVAFGCSLVVKLVRCGCGSSTIQHQRVGRLKLDLSLVTCLREGRAIPNAHLLVALRADPVDGLLPSADDWRIKKRITSTFTVYNRSFVSTTAPACPHESFDASKLGQAGGWRCSEIASVSAKER